MTLKSDVKFKEKLTCGFKYDMMKLVNFHPNTQKSESSCPRYMRFELKNKGELSFMTLNSDAKFE